MWNSLPVDIKNIDSFSCFKKGFKYILKINLAYNEE